MRRAGWCELAVGREVRQRVMEASTSLRRLWRDGSYRHWDALLGAVGEPPLRRLSDPAELEFGPPVLIEE